MIDKVDMAVLCELDCNSRNSLSSIGKAARLSKEGAHYRIQKLEKSGIIKGYPTIISLAKRGKVHCEIFLKYRNVTVPLKMEMIDFFVKQPEIVYVNSCKGSWDLLLGIVVNSLSELNEVKNRLCDNYSEYWSSFEISLTIETYFFGRKYLRGKDIHVTQHIDSPGNINLDEKDEAILGVLSQNSRTSLLEIAKRIKLTPKAVAYRIKKMEKSRVIQKYTVSLNTKKMGFLSFKMLIRLKSSDQKHKLLEYFHMQENAINTREVLSDWNLEPMFEVPSPERFYSIVEEIEELFGESIISHSSLMLDNEYKSFFYQ